MAKTSYNGFDAEQRTRADAWYNQQKADGAIVVAAMCCTCSSRDRVNGHTEDYSEPFGAHIGAFDLCWICHMMVHCRHRNPRRWAQYINVLEAGWYFDWPTLDWQHFVPMFLGSEFVGERTEQAHEPSVLIRDISMGVYNPNNRGLKYWHPELKALLVTQAGLTPGMLR